MSSLSKRIVSAVIVILILIAALWFDRRNASGWGLASAMALFTAMCLREFYRMARVRGGEPFAVFGILMGIALTFGHERWCLEKWHGLARVRPDMLYGLIALAAIGCFLMPVLRRRPRGAINNVATTLLGLIYAWFLPSFVARLRHLGMPGANGWVSDGIEFVIVCIFVAKCSDVGGLLVGSKLGRHRLVPEISPKKTWEGLCGGIALSLAAISLTMVSTRGALAKMGWAQVLPLGVVLALAALLGDLVESAFKRDSEVKDAGGAVPGFGGVLDLVDSLMVSAPAMYYYLVVVSGAEAGWIP